MPRLPERYAEGLDGPFTSLVLAALRPGISVLDVGSGRRPSVPLEARPVGCKYVGLDVSGVELENAPEGSYDRTFVSDVADHVAALDGSFDLVVSFQVLEHVQDLRAATTNLATYLRPEGRLIAQFSGRFALFALLNSLLPRSLGVWLLEHLTGATREKTFPAYYDRCWASAIRRCFRDWSVVRLRARYFGASYFRFLPPLEAAYLVYEDWACDGGHENLATHYLIDAVR